MSHALPYFPPSPFEELSEEEQIKYIETHLDELVAELRASKLIPRWHAEILADSLAHARYESEHGIPWEEFEKEFMKE